MLGTGVLVLMLSDLHLQIASLFVVNLQTHVSWAWGYAVPTMAFGLALTLFLAGTRLYKFVPPGGSALTRMGQVHLRSYTPVWGMTMLKPSRLQPDPAAGKSCVVRFCDRHCQSPQTCQ